MKQVITMGETMAAVVPTERGPLRYVESCRFRIAGAESNTAIGLAKLGVPACWLSRLGDDELGRLILGKLRAEGVDCSHVSFDPLHRTGVMFKEYGATETSVYYYRENSAASHLSPEDIDEALFSDAALLHLTGITPVLSESCRAAVEKAMTLAKDAGVPVSFDPNVRRKLWGGNDYAPLLRSLAMKSDIVLLGMDEAETLFGISEPKAIFDTLFSGGVRYAAIKNGGRGAVAADRKGRYPIDPYPCVSVDPVGAGDGFNAGFLAGLLQGKGTREAGRMGAVCGALATQVPGDVEGYPDEAQMEAALHSGKIIYR